MAANLPRELLFLIAEHLSRQSSSLLPYALVSRDWQPVYESFIFSAVTVYSGSRDGTKAREQKGFSLEDFNTATSGQNFRRRAWIREVRYDILVPYELLDWSNTKWDESYTVDNPVRKSNETAFQTAMTRLFTGVLSSWDQAHRLSVQIGLLGCKQGFELEPDTYRYDDAGDYRFDFTDGRTEALLSFVPCVDKLTFANWRRRYGRPFLFYEVQEDDEYDYYPERDPRPRNRWHQIWAGTVFQIAEHCPTMTELHLDLHEYVRPDHLEYIRDRRAAVAEGVLKLSGSLRVLNLTGYNEEPWKQTMSALNVLKTNHDTLAASLRDLSLVLRELRLTYVSLSTDWLYPLDGSGQPTADPTSLHWPNLKILTLEKAPPFTPQGKWLALPDADEQQIIDNVTDWETEICNTERGCLTRPILDTEQFHRLFISWGHAARNMPQINSMRFYVTHTTWVDFRFTIAAPGAEVTLSWGHDSAFYLPDHRVARAWGFDLKQLTSDQPGLYSASLPCWPPVAW
ncbi:hypothetical protein BJY00DRAFT_301671 [Aspergillus carlsbadensis]|nr:hypothetical protein BJY00DRAFT_301671 [Aspergillus carlsbadensis]